MLRAPANCRTLDGVNETGNISGSGYVGMQSPDGRWTWNGAQWVPTQAAQPQQKSTFWPMLGAMIAFAVIVMIGIGFYGAHERQQQDRDDVENYFCQYDPDC